MFSVLQPVPKLVVGGGDDPHPLGLSIGVHLGRPDVSVPARLLGVVLGAELLSARVLSLLYVRPGPERGGCGRRSVRELHHQTHRVLDARGTELLRAIRLGLSGLPSDGKILLMLLPEGAQKSLSWFRSSECLWNGKRLVFLIHVCME